jgi:D-alanyl-D-alanine carboxypeptidase/D-alanyl-D-alanine-endopeptidase (penicillin-binding protein 4)
LLGANKDGSYSQEKGIENILLSLKNSGLKTDAIAMQDGSGLSDQNKVTPMLLGEVLKEAYRDFSVEPFMVSSLSRFEQSGTLKERILVDSPQRQISNMKAKKTDFLVKGIWGKTGTLSSVSSLAGYLRDENDKIVIYVIIENGALPKDKAVQIENKIVRTLAGVL